MSTPKPVFVIWDQTIPNLKSDLGAMRQHSQLVDVPLHALGLDASVIG